MVTKQCNPALEVISSVRVITECDDAAAVMSVALVRLLAETLAHLRVNYMTLRHYHGHVVRQQVHDVGLSSFFCLTSFRKNIFSYQYAISLK